LSTSKNSRDRELVTSNNNADLQDGTIKDRNTKEEVCPIERAYTALSYVKGPTLEGAAEARINHDDAASLCRLQTK
jgi:hypothetical protein